MAIVPDELCVLELNFFIFTKKAIALYGES